MTTTAYDDLTLDAILECIRTHRWWEGESRVVGILANWHEGKGYSAAVFHPARFRPALMPQNALEAQYSSDAATAREAARTLLQRLDDMLAREVARLRGDRDQRLAQANQKIEQLTGAPEPVPAGGSAT